MDGSSGNNGTMSTVATSAVADHTFLGTVGRTCTTCTNGDMSNRDNTSRGTSTRDNTSGIRRGRGGKWTSVDGVGVLVGKLVGRGPAFILLLNVYPALTAAADTVGNLSVKLTAVTMLIYAGFIVSYVGGVAPSVIHVPIFVIIVTTFMAVLRVLVDTCTPSDVGRTLNVCVPLVMIGYVVLNETRDFTTGGSPVTDLFSNLNYNLNFALTLAVLNTTHRVLNTKDMFNVALLPRAAGVLVFVLPPKTFLALKCVVTVFGGIGGWT